MNTDERIYFERLRAYESDLDGWRIRAQKVEMPQTGSELDKDDAVFPYSPISDASRVCLISAGSIFASHGLRSRQGIYTQLRTLRLYVEHWLLHRRQFIFWGPMKQASVVVGVSR